MKHHISTESVAIMHALNNQEDACQTNRIGKKAVTETNFHIQKLSGTITTLRWAL